MGTGFPEGPQGFNVGRNVAMMAGLPVTVPGQTVSRFCSSGLQAVATAAHMVENEGAEAVIGGGLESITMMQNDFNKNNLFNPWLMDHKKAIYMPMGLTAEIVAERYKVSREKQDELALASQKRTAAAQQSGKFKDEISPMTVEMEVTDKATGEKSRKTGHRRQGRVQPSRHHRRGPGQAAAARSSRTAAASPPATRRSSPTAPRRA